ncbi:group III truncated hemoglobin [Aquimarina sp. W85]|uniref:group III truncated hemoglobin n=1 Tax=Aquimarina rhodophyticola TaxID=3342246 RepID=UPI00366A7471
MKSDIICRKDLEFLMNSFYGEVLADPQIGFIFTDIAQLNINKHLPIIVDFWEMNVLRTGSYRNNVMKIHQDLNLKFPLKASHFEIWLTLFNKTVDHLYQGINAQRIKTNALSIATVIQVKLSNEEINNLN